MDIVTIVGSLAALASMVSFTPQAWKIIKSRQTKDLSAVMYGITVVGFALWTSYGIMLMQWPIIVTNAVCLLLAGFILVMKLLPRRTRNTVADVLDPDATP
jgi:MtN3 and saliva related transmembrane protein